ncbi:MAG: FAD-dependent oxidoreductase, partial [Pseudomonadota bacterium]
EPALAPEFNAAILIKGAGRVRSPGRLATVLFEKAQALGATFVTAQIKGLSQTETGWQITLEDRAMTAERLVICMGVWSAELLKDLPLQIPLMSERGYHAEFADPGIELNNSILDTDGKFIASSMEGGVRVAGHAEFAPPDAPPSKERERTLLRLAQNAFPHLQTKDVTFWMGSRPSFPDSLPMIDEVDGLPGLYLNFGHSHYGLMMSPASGELTARMICRETPNADLSAYSASRF